MSTSTVLYLPPYVRLRDAANALGVLLGQPHEVVPFSTGSGGAIMVKGVTTEGYASPGLAECAKIVIQTPTEHRQLMWHYEMDDPAQNVSRGHHGIMFGCTRANIALAEAMVEFFGGAVDHDDCDERGIDFQLSPDESAWGHDFSPNDGALWDEMQRKLDALEAL